MGRGPFRPGLGRAFRPSPEVGLPWCSCPSRGPERRETAAPQPPVRPPGWRGCLLPAAPGAAAPSPGREAEEGGEGGTRAAAAGSPSSPGRFPRRSATHFLGAHLACGERSPTRAPRDAPSPRQTPGVGPPGPQPRPATPLGPRATAPGSPRSTRGGAVGFGSRAAPGGRPPAASGRRPSRPRPRAGGARRALRWVLVPGGGAGDSEAGTCAPSPARGSPAPGGPTAALARLPLRPPPAMRSAQPLVLFSLVAFCRRGEYFFGRGGRGARVQRPQVGGRGGRRRPRERPEVVPAGWTPAAEPRAKASAAGRAPGLRGLGRGLPPPAHLPAQPPRRAPWAEPGPRGTGSAPPRREAAGHRFQIPTGSSPAGCRRQRAHPNAGR